MPTHFSFAFGLGNMFNFKFEYRPREPSPSRFDPRSIMSDYDLARVRHQILTGLKVRPLMI